MQNKEDPCTSLIDPYEDQDVASAEKSCNPRMQFMRSQNIWSIPILDTNEIIPLRVAKKPVIPRVWAAMQRQSPAADVLPARRPIPMNRLFGFYYAELKAAFFKLDFADAFFLEDGTVLFLYSHKKAWERASKALPGKIAGYLVVPLIGMINQSSSIPFSGQEQYEDSEVMSAGSTIHSKDCSSTAALGLTVREKSTEAIFHTLCSHVPQGAAYRLYDGFWGYFKYWRDYLAGQDTFRFWPALYFDKKKIGEIEICYDEYLRSGDKWPINIKHDLSLVKAEECLIQERGLTFHEDPTQLPFDALLRLVEDQKIRGDGRMLPMHTRVRVGAGLHKRGYGVNTELAESLLWRSPAVGTREDEWSQMLQSASGTAICFGNQVVGFQNFELSVLSHYPGNQTEEQISQAISEGRIGFYGSFILPELFTNNYEIV